MHISTDIMQISLEGPQNNLKREVPFCPATPFQGRDPRNSILYCRDPCISMFIAALFLIAGTEPIYKLTTDEWIMRMCSMYKMECSSSVKKTEIYRKMDGFRKCNVEQSHPKSERKNNHLPHQIQILAFNGSVCANSCQQLPQQLEKKSSTRSWQRRGQNKGRARAEKEKIRFTVSLVSTLSWFFHFLWRKSAYIKRYCWPRGGGACL